MDKLEKALEKAREQRKIELENQAGVQQRVAAEREEIRKQQPVVTSSNVEISAVDLEEHHIIAHHTRSHEADIFRILRTKILQIMAQSGYKTLGITSANYGDGKTTTSLNLAVSIALDLKQTVLLVDLDLRKPNVTEYLGIQPQYGISDYFLHDIPISQCMLRPSFDRMTILPAGQPVDNSSEVLGSPKIAELARELRTRYPDRFIIYDMPPTLAQDDPIAFLPHVDAVLLVVNDGATKINELKQSLHVLAGANVIGTVLNTSAEKKSSTHLSKLIKYIDRSFNTSQPTNAE
jgi:capsular exopolysaccharide synthesis family protein